MVTIKLFNSPFQNSYTTHNAECVGDFLIEHYGFNSGVNIQVLLNDVDITHDIDRQCITDDCEYVVLESPGGFFDIIASTLAVASIISALTFRPKLPNSAFQNRSQSSPNNDLISRANSARPLERVEDIFGTVRSIPSLMMPTYSKFIANTEYEYGYYCVGRGYYDIDDVKDGDTLISSISGSKASFYNPFASPNSGSPFLQIGGTIEDDVLTVSRTKQVDGITLKALNQVQVTNPDNYTFNGSTISQATKAPNFNSIVDSGDFVTVTTGSFFVLKIDDSATISAANSDNSFNSSASEFSDFNPGDVIRTSGFVNGANNGTFTVSTATSSKLVVTGGTLVDESSGGTIDVERQNNYDGTYEVDTVADGSITLVSTTFQDAATVSSMVTLDGVTDNWSAWFTLPDTSRTQVWSNVIAANGMFKDGGSGEINTSVNFQFEIEEIVGGTPTGTVETVNASINGSTQDQRGVTIEQVTAFTGTCRVRARRTSNFDYSFNGTVVDEIKWRDLYAVTPESKANFGNKTTVHTVVKATERATAIQNRELNCLASRRIPTYNGTTFSGAFDSTGLLSSGTISATSKMVDIVAAISVDPKIGNLTLANEVDIDQIYSVQQTLDAWGSTYGTFNYTFDDDKTSFEEIISRIAGACFSRAYRQSGKIRFALDVSRTNPSQTFTHRNKKPDSETITRIFEPEYNAIKFTYIDSITEKREEIIIGDGSKVKTIDNEGVTDFAQAWLLANREYNSIHYAKINLQFDSTADGRNLVPGALIDVVDDTRYKRYGGEVLAKSGLTLTLSQDVAFTTGENHSVILMKRDSSIESIACTSGTQANQIVLSYEPVEAVVTDYSENGIRTIFSFASDSARLSQRYLVTNLEPNSSGEYVTITAINYSDNYYTADDQAIPSRISTIGVA